MAEEHEYVIVMLRDFIHAVFPFSVSVLRKQFIKSLYNGSVVSCDLAALHYLGVVPLIFIMKIRIGNEVGTHEILISNGNETITLKHEAENRALFAQGALKAASFMEGKEPGFYNMDNMV